MITLSGSWSARHVQGKSCLSKHPVQQHQLQNTVYIKGCSAVSRAFCLMVYVREYTCTWCMTVSAHYMCLYFADRRPLKAYAPLTWHPFTPGCRTRFLHDDHCKLHFPAAMRPIQVQHSWQLHSWQGLGVLYLGFLESQISWKFGFCPQDIHLDNCRVARTTLKSTKCLPAATKVSRKCLLRTSQAAW